MMIDSPAYLRPVPRWVHAWAILTLACALPLILFGAHVTTTGAGMVDQVGYRNPQDLMATLLSQFHTVLEQVNLGIVYEYGHRLLGMLVGCCAIVLAAVLLLTGRQPLVRWAGVVALAMVVVQGLLGKYRVDLNTHFGPNLALIHGLFAQLVLAVLVGCVVMTSPRWWSQRSAPHEDTGLRRTADVLALMLFVQIVLGAVVRHFGTRLAQRLHILFAFAAVAIAVALIQRLWAASYRRTAVFVAALVVLQLALGVESWLGRFGRSMPIEYLRGETFESQPSLMALVARTAHFVVGAVLFATAAAVAFSMRRPAPVPSNVPAYAGAMEGAA
jgi:cytochrome c oxidase assembly protein subunit 15